MTMYCVIRGRKKRKTAFSTTLSLWWVVLFYPVSHLPVLRGNLKWMMNRNGRTCCLYLHFKLCLNSFLFFFSFFVPPAVSPEGPAVPGPVEEPEPVCAAGSGRRLAERRLGSQRRLSESQAHHLQLFPPRSRGQQSQRREHRGLPNQQQHKWDLVDFRSQSPANGAGPKHIVHISLVCWGEGFWRLCAEWIKRGERWFLFCDNPVQGLHGWGDASMNALQSACE